MVYQDKVEKEVGAQQEFVSKTQQQIDTSLQNIGRVISGLLYNKSFMRIMRNDDISASYIQYSNEILDTMVALDAPHFSSHRIIAFTPDTYFTFTKTGEDQAHILNAIASYDYYDQVVKAEGCSLLIEFFIEIKSRPSMSLSVLKAFCCLKLACLYHKPHNSILHIWLNPDTLALT